MKKGLLFVLAMILMVGSVMGLPAGLPVQGQTGTDSNYGSYDWIVCRADSDSAWISSYNHPYIRFVNGQKRMFNTGGHYNPLDVCQSLGYESVSAYGGTCGRVCGFCYTDKGEYYDGLGGSPTSLRWTVHWQCHHYIGGGNTGNNVPEFGFVAAGLALLGAGLFIRKKRN